MNTEAKSDLLDWLTQSRSSFDVVVCNRDQLEGDFIVLDSTSIDGVLRSTQLDRIGGVPLQKANGVLQQTSHRVAQQLASAHAQRLGVSINGLCNAWFHPIWAELATLIPIRHLARQLAAQNVRQPFAIPLKTLSFTTINSWSKNDLEPLYLAYALRQRKVPVVLFVEGKGEEGFEFKLSETWLPKGRPQIRRNKEFTTVVCKRGMRRASFVSEKLVAKRWNKPDLFTIKRLLRIDCSPGKFNLKLQRGPLLNDIQSFSAPMGIPSLVDGFVELMGPLTQKTALWYRQEFGKHSIKHAHIADHASFEGGLLASEVTKKGGQVFLWPHSANLVHMHVHDPRDVAQITVAARSTGECWSKVFGNDKVSIDRRAILPETTSVSSFDKNLPVHVVLFAGAHAIKRMPLIDYELHCDTWSRVLRDLYDSDVALTLKHKSSWETREWITGLAPKGARLRFTNTRANKLNFPNMLFASISLTSTAIFEGIARGVPGITVRDTQVDETPYYDPEFVPCVPSNTVLEFVSNLNSKAAMDKLRDRQRVWFERETSPN